ncbi:MAG: (2Fe-2S)-binding protein [Gemmatimonadetes bacterium]|nr:(2Fe-2S)-binding protein [Gemmatimonadota bacterium]
MKITINGSEHDLDVPSEMPLLWAVRDIAGLTGTKYGCGIGQCGACTVHLDGVPTRSCIVAVGSVGAKKVTTIEGLAAGGQDHPVQQAWQQLNVPQCGYCQAGQLMTAAALLAATPNPSEDAIDRAMSGNLCRCGTYLRIRHAVKLAAEIRAGGAK